MKFFPNFSAGVLGCIAAAVFAAEDQPLGASYALPSAREHLVGELGVVHTREQDTLVDIAAGQRLGYDSLRAANPAVDAWLPGENTQLILPTRFILPDSPREGIVINVAEMRLYYFPEASDEVEVYAISVGRGSWQTPLTRSEIVSKVENPVWFPPPEIRKEHADRGDPLPMRVPPGPDNPLGKYVMTLDIPGYFIHGTNKKYGIGMQVTHGCIRMYPEHIEHLVFAVPNGTSVSIVNQRYKMGWSAGQLYLEVHPALEGLVVDEQADRDVLATMVEQYLAVAEGGSVRWDIIEQLLDQPNGLPTVVGGS